MQYLLYILACVILGSCCVYHVSKISDEKKISQIGICSTKNSPLAMDNENFPITLHEMDEYREEINQ